LHPSLSTNQFSCVATALAHQVSAIAAGASESQPLGHLWLTTTSHYLLMYFIDVLSFLLSIEQWHCKLCHFAPASAENFAFPESKAPEVDEKSELWELWASVGQVAVPLTIKINQV
jgi:hypothetical protein